MSESFNPFSLAGKIILVTGASSGIGRATAIVCSKMGASLVVTGRNECRLNETVSQLEGSNHLSIIADLANQEGRDKLFNAIDRIDGVVHCAGISGHKVFQFLKEDEIQRMFDINFNTPLLLSRDFIKKKKITKGGSIIFITSTSGIISSYIGGSLYSSTKGALNGLIKGMALELAAKNIRVNSVMPSMVSTPIMNGGQLTNEQFEDDKKRYPLKRYGYPEEVAYAVVYLLSEASAWTTGTNLLLDGGLSIAY
ncbi:MAG: SDR family oxidoreductase [Muribaculaceae bacterium]|nr:SDR family oxidoreductase [Muribaculaceae bacterium]